MSGFSLVNKGTRTTSITKRNNVRSRYSKKEMTSYRKSCFVLLFQVDELKKQVAELEIARSRLSQEGGDLGKQVEEFETKFTLLMKAKKTLEATVEDLKRTNEEETRVG